MIAVAQALGGAGFDVVRFNFPYREKGSKRPDPMPILKDCIAQVVADVRKQVNPRRLIIGGRSMGGRAASMLAAEASMRRAAPARLSAASGGKPEELRDAHLPQIRVPVLCFNGTRDALCQRELMEQVLGRLSWRMHWLEGADHSFRVLKSSGKRDDDVLRELADVARDWLTHLA